MSFTNSLVYNDPNPNREGSAQCERASELCISHFDCKWLSNCGLDEELGTICVGSSAKPSPTIMNLYPRCFLGNSTGSKLFKLAKVRRYLSLFSKESNGRHYSHCVFYFKCFILVEKFFSCLMIAEQKLQSFKYSVYYSGSKIPHQILASPLRHVLFFFG